MLLNATGCSEAPTSHAPTVSKDSYVAYYCKNSFSITVLHLKINLNDQHRNTKKTVRDGTNASESLEPVFCKKQQRIVPDQLLVCGVGDL